MSSEINLEDVQIKLLLSCPVCEEKITSSKFSIYKDDQVYSENIILDLTCPECGDEVQIIIN